MFPVYLTKVILSTASQLPANVNKGPEQFGKEITQRYLSHFSGKLGKATFVYDHVIFYLHLHSCLFFKHLCIPPSSTVTGIATKLLINI